MNLPNWVSVISGITAILGTFWAVHRFVTKALIKDYLSELKPNGGGSLKDKVNDINQKVNNLETRVDQIYTILVSAKKD